MHRLPGLRCLAHRYIAALNVRRKIANAVALGWITEAR